MKTKKALRPSMRKLSWATNPRTRTFPNANSTGLKNACTAIHNIAALAHAIPAKLIALAIFFAIRGQQSQYGRGHQHNHRTGKQSNRSHRPNPPASRQ